MSLTRKTRMRNEERILNAAEHNFRTRGFEKTRMSDIAAQAEVADKTLFNYFRSKEQLVLALVVRWLESHADQIIEEGTLHSLPLEEVLPPGRDHRLDLLNQERWLAEIAAAKTDILVSYRWNAQSRTELLLANRQARINKIREAQSLGQVTATLSAELISHIYEGIRDNLIGHWLMAPGSEVSQLKVQMRQAIEVLLKGIAPDSEEQKG